MLRMTLHRFRLPMLSLAMGLSLVLLLATLADAQPPKLLLDTDPPITRPVAADDTIKTTIAYEDLPELDPSASIVLKVDWTGLVEFKDSAGIAKTVTSPLGAVQVGQPASTQTAEGIKTAQATETNSPTITPAGVTPISKPKEAGNKGTDERSLGKPLIAALAVIFLAILAIFLLRRQKPEPTTELAMAPTPVPIPPPSSTSGAYLESVLVPGMGMRIKDGVTTIGRDPDCDIRITESWPEWETVSRRHAEIRREGGGYVIYDVSNRNGVYVQGLRTAKNLLLTGTPIAIGGVEFVFHDSTTTGQ